MDCGQAQYLTEKIHKRSIIGGMGIVNMVGLGNGRLNTSILVTELKAIFN